MDCCVGIASYTLLCGFGTPATMYFVYLKDAVIPIVINEMRAKHHDFQVKLIRVGFDPKHDGGQFGVVRSVACCHTHPQFPLTLHQTEV